MIYQVHPHSSCQPCNEHEGGSTTFDFSYEYNKHTTQAMNIIFLLKEVPSTEKTDVTCAVMMC